MISKRSQEVVLSENTKWYILRKYLALKGYKVSHDVKKKLMAIKVTKTILDTGSPLATTFSQIFWNNISSAVTQTIVFSK